MKYLLYLSLFTLLACSETADIPVPATVDKTFTQTGKGSWKKDNTTCGDTNNDGKIDTLTFTTAQGFVLMTDEDLDGFFEQQRNFNSLHKLLSEKAIKRPVPTLGRSE